ncbi:hypothetical protein GALMADRAFT_238026 [Galerina marginata CBS 339.88]|uniref:Uncharacterized protein n=1 Tax=Galerina marginata (strain CBS 339.88) TaxID=685588 RepID=A0A067TUG2_GALM3|nr:hypothetical protein GALMADRAFT_238026 [Galerina marginata CBS 339.88]
MSSQFHQAQQEGLCLRFPDNIPPQREITYETAVNLLLRGTAMAANVPFTWSFVDKPSDGTILLLFLPLNSPYPNDGIRYQDSEVKYTIPAGPRELEVYEVKYGFIPGSGDSNASRVRRRYRLVKGGNNQFVLVHYTRGPATLVPPALMSQPIRAYPLRPVNEASVYVTGDKTGQKVYPQGVGPMHAGGVGPGPVPGPAPPATIGLNMNYSQQQAMLAQQSSNMEALERRRERERERERASQRNDPAAGRPPQQRPPDDDDSGDEIDQISTRTLALARYKRNHDWMNEVFHQAAFGKILATEPKPRPYSVFSKSEIDEKTAKLQAELDALQSKTAQRRADKIRDAQSQSISVAQESSDLSMGGGDPSAIPV